MEPVAKVIEAKVVSETDLFDDPLFSTLKECTVWALTLLPTTIAIKNKICFIIF